ncbi:hypothetical protein IC232_03400 [Microvirga sp. BT688]|uniref:hypothetical protein n=1 Tax=Microvirga sp. TaxID=1873136 RepID=UPI0016850A3F|nr:hypothetical protein [Microvirga sp.]MBD2745735.1 hypothetical protein [Microvirga sp.]
MTRKFALQGDYDLNDIATILQALDDYAKSAKADAHVFRQDLLSAGAEGAGAAVTPRRIPALMEKLRRSAEIGTREDREASSSQFDNWYEAKVDAQPDAMKALVQQYSLDIDHTGGGCLAYARHYEDNWYWWLTADDGTSLPIDPDDKTCQIGAYHPDGEWWLNSSATPHQALSVIGTFVAVAKARFAAGHPATFAEFKEILTTAQTSGYFVPDEATAIAEILTATEEISDDRPLWQREFPRFEADWIPDLPEGFEDYSWHNDACPRFHNIMRDLVLWVDYPDPQEREIVENLRYSVCRELDDGSMEDLYSADEWSLVQDFIDNYTPPAGTAPNYNTLLMLAEEAKCKSDNDWGSERQVEAENRFFKAARQRFPDHFSDTNDDWQEAIHKATSDEIIEEAMRRIVQEVVKQNPNLAALLAPKTN